ncbi:GMP synthase [glutamine-hydrolyzing] subunit A [Candidatus Methanobinarius endosymbioticus]|uniref:GMP synthase [glutamine-hydrolyzing] subunit A n=1 Tax=Candidatus Methanobinarius endosymbioticus TaxID=2006182 RepID=A0A366MAM5_9EURY|nr:GMP synthase [glutamine-hydrolyzing] subunit A [Candidatus Methanobinarius endosymbioticus]
MINFSMKFLLLGQVWSSHKDEVKTLPNDFEILANSVICDIKAMKHKQKDIYGIQFHPEVHHIPKKMN